MAAAEAGQPLRYSQRVVLVTDLQRNPEPAAGRQTRLNVSPEHVPGSQPKLAVTFEPVEGPDVCPECGRQLVLKLRFDDPLDRRVGR